MKKVDIKLYREVPRTGGSGQTRLVFEEDIQAAVDNSGSLMWTVPSTVTPRETYSVLVVVTGSSEDGTPIFQTTPVFAIREGPTGPCLPGTVSSSGMQPGCTPCPKGTFVSAMASDAMPSFPRLSPNYPRLPSPLSHPMATTKGASPTACTSCLGGLTTPAEGASAKADCSVDASSPLAKFSFRNGFSLVGQSFRTHRKVDVARCALLCSLDKTCKSFDFSL